MNSGQVNWESLAGRIQDCLQKAGNSASGIRFGFSMSEKFKSDQTHASAEAFQVLRIVQEAIQNPIKHGEAHAVRVQIREMNIAAEIIVQDDK